MLVIELIAVVFLAWLLFATLIVTVLRVPRPRSGFWQWLVCWPVAVLLILLWIGESVSDRWKRAHWQP